MTEEASTSKELDDLKAALDEHAIVAITDQTGKIIYVNEKFCAISKYSREELLGQDHRIINSGYHPKEFIRNLWTTIANGKVWKGEFCNRAKDGSIYWVDATIVPFLNDNGKPFQYVAIRTDITARKKAEEERERLGERLRQAQKMEAVGRLASGVAHDFNNMLMIIRAQAEVALLHFDRETPVAKRVEEIMRTVERAASLTGQLLAFSRQQVLQLEIIDLQHLLREHVKMLPRILGEHIHVTLAEDPDLKRIKADAGQITQVLLNLALNARDAMSNGGRLVIEAKNLEIESNEEPLFHNVTAGRYILISVSDNGAGMSKTAQAHAFEPFFTTKEKGKGTGLGLATVSGIIEQLGGAIHFYSDEGRGTSFKIYLPQVPESAEHHTDSAPAVAAARTVSSPGGVLLVEDEDELRKGIAEYLEASGIAVLQAKNGRQALDILAEKPSEPAVVVTDVIMPDMGGPELAARLRAEGRNFRLIYMSGYTDRDMNTALAEDASIYLQKPFKLKDLLQRITQP